MFIAAAIVSGLLALALALVASGRAKLVKEPQTMKVMTKVGIPEDQVWLLAAARCQGRDWPLALCAWRMRARP